MTPPPIPPPPSPEEFESLNAFFLGRRYDPDRGETTPELLLYDSKDLTTHAVCVGMTGSGKTGLCIGLLEEAAIDGIPALILDPKGDLGNLLLTFPSLAAEDFRPWIDPGEATREGMDVDRYAADRAEFWKRGLAKWGQDGARIARLREAAEFAIYTPGSDAGRPLSVLRSFRAPPPALREDRDAFQERILAAVSSLLALLGIEADPLQSREHILLSSLFDHEWGQGKGLDLATLIRAIQAPPFDRIGVMDLEAVYPQSERFRLSMGINNLLASPSFAAWRQGEALDISRLLFTDAGKPRVSILSIAHLSDPERMFFVTQVLNEVVAWMRSQPGTASLRAILYMDEVFGYFPPSANPPSKRPMLTLLKQARAYGVGVVLATQNPVDLDYKGLANAGTWFLGRLQTERDKARVLDGLEGASSSAGRGFDRARMEAILSGLKSRRFLMNNVHDDEPVLFETRFVLSYLRGPLTRAQIRSLCSQAPEPRRAPPPSGPAAPSLPVAGEAEALVAVEGAEAKRPILPEAVRECFAPVVVPVRRSEEIRYRPALLGRAELHYRNARAGVDRWQRISCYVPLEGSGSASQVWRDAVRLRDADLKFERDPEEALSFEALPRTARLAKSYSTFGKSLKNHLYRTLPLTLRRCQRPKLISEVGESEREFEIRLREGLRELRDLEVEKLRQKYTPKLERLKERIRRAETKVERERDQYDRSKQSALISFGSTLLGALFGRRSRSGTIGRAGTALRRAGRTGKERRDIEWAEEDVDRHREELGRLDEEFREEVERCKEELVPDRVKITELVVRPLKTDLLVDSVELLWLPWQVSESGRMEPAFADLSTEVSS